MRKAKYVLLVIAAINVFSGRIFASETNEFSLWGSGEVFKCSPILDGVLGGCGALIYGTELILQKGVKLNQNQFGEDKLDKNQVNAFDRLFMQPYSKPLDVTADILMVTALASPAILLATENISEWMTIGVMYAETLLLAQGVKEISKLFINRARPYMYYDGFPQKDVYDDLDWNNSCPSGHSTMAFMGASFLSYVFCSYNPKSGWRYPVVIGSFALAATTAALRVASGNHFVTDVLIGAALGSGIGILVPWLHTLTANKNGTEIANGNSSRGGIYVAGVPVASGGRNRMQIAVSPLGMNCSVRF